jgi:hypothetical protein
MKICAENESDQLYRVVRKSDGEEVKYVTGADTDSGAYTRWAVDENGRFRASHHVAREVIEQNGDVHRFDDDGNEVGEPEYALEEIREPFRIVHKKTREVVAETAE